MNLCVAACEVLLLIEVSRVHFSCVSASSLPSTQVGPAEARDCVIGLVAIAGTHVACSFLRSLDLRLQGRSVVVDPFQLMKVSVKNTHNLAKLF